MHDFVDLIGYAALQDTHMAAGVSRLWARRALLHLSFQVVFSKPWLSIPHHLGIIRTKTGKDGRVVVILSSQMGGVPISTIIIHFHGVSNNNNLLTIPI